MNMKEYAYTLMEILIVLIIISILAGMAVIYTNRPLEMMKGKAARAVLQAIYAAEREYCIKRGSFADLPTLINEGYADNPNDPDQRDWTYRIEGVGGESINDCGTFTAEAERRTASGGTITINQDGDYADNFFY